MFAKFKELLKNKYYKWIFIALLIIMSPFLVALAVVFWPLIIATGLFIYFKKYTFKLNKFIIVILAFATLGVQAIAISSFPSPKPETNKPPVVQKVTENIQNDIVIKTQNIEETKLDPEIKAEVRPIEDKIQTVETAPNLDIPTSAPTPININSTTVSENIKNTDSPKQLFTVTKVVDGDTLTLDKIGTVRLIGINTPETVDPRKPVECFGIEASNKAKDLLNGKKVYLEYDETQGKTDKYNRTLAYAFLEDGLNFNAEMIKTGYAYEYTYDKPYKYQSEFKQAQKDAQNSQWGLWSPNTCSGQLIVVKEATEETKIPVVTENKANTSNQTPTPTTPKNIPEITPEPQNLGEPNVKKSKSGNKCHDRTSRSYNQTKYYTSYNTIEECLNSGGILPIK